MKLMKTVAILTAGIMAFSSMAVSASAKTTISVFDNSAQDLIAVEDDDVAGGMLYCDGEGVIKGCDPTVVSAVVPVTVDTIKIVEIGDSAFANCKELISVKLPSTITDIGRYAFQNCTELTDVNVPDSVSYLGDKAFASCESLVNVTLSKKLTSIGSEMFSGCKELTSIEIPSGVKTIGENAFRGCEALQSVNIPEGVSVIAEGTFNNCRSLSEIAFPEELTSIGASSFYNCAGLSEIELPEGLTSIGESAFFATGVKEIAIPDSVTQIGKNAFGNCKDLVVKCSKNSAADDKSLYPQGTKIEYIGEAASEEPETEAKTEPETEKVTEAETEALTEAEEAPEKAGYDVKVTIGVKSVVVGDTSYETDAAAYIQKESNSTLVPLRAVTIAVAGGSPDADSSNIVEWDASTKTATINAGGRKISFTAGSSVMTIDGSEVTMDNGVVAEITEGRMYIPFRALGTALGVSVDWDASTKTGIYKVG